jgi:hypothetical protein
MSAGNLLCVKYPGKTQISEENVSRIREAFQWIPRKFIHAASLQLHTNSMINSAWCATQKTLPESIPDLNDSCTKTEWPSNTRKLCCGHPRKNWHVTWFLPPSVLRRSNIPYHWSFKQVHTTKGFGVLKIHISYVNWREPAPKWTHGVA